MAAIEGDPSAECRHAIASGTSLGACSGRGAARPARCAGRPGRASGAMARGVGAGRGNRRHPPFGAGGGCLGAHQAGARGADVRTRRGAGPRGDHAAGLRGPVPAAARSDGRAPPRAGAAAGHAHRRRHRAGHGRRRGLRADHARRPVFAPVHADPGRRAAEVPYAVRRAVRRTAAAAAGAAAGVARLDRVRDLRQPERLRADPQPALQPAADRRRRARPGRQPQQAQVRRPGRAQRRGAHRPVPPAGLPPRHRPDHVDCRCRCTSATSIGAACGWAIR